LTRDAAAGAGPPGPAPAGSYDAVAERYAVEIASELAAKPVDRALYRLFAELITAGDLGEVSDAGTVGDVGCGPGHVAAHLAGLGLRPLGVDPSPGMIAVARARYPEIAFELGSFAALPVGTAGWAGAVAPYSIIHVPDTDRPAAWTELARAIRPGGWLLVAFHIEDADHPAGSTRHVREWWGHAVDLQFHFLDPAPIAAELAESGFRVMVRTDREPWTDIEHPSRRSYLLARRE
jgi:SAM-dependent methyltransferase